VPPHHFQSLESPDQKPLIGQFPDISSLGSYRYERILRCCDSPFPFPIPIGIHSQCRVFAIISILSQSFNTYWVCVNSVKEKCRNCGEDVLQADLIQHMRNHMGPRRCEVCNYEAPTKHHLREHLNVHSGLEIYLNPIVPIINKS
jgi:hypothetical protein